MPDGHRISRRDGLKILAAAGAVGTIGAVALTSGQEDGNRTLEWGGQGDENALLECPDGETGIWRWVLTPGGPTRLEEDAVLTVNFTDEETVEAEGFRPGGGGGAVHFVVERETGGEVDSASVSFTGGGPNPVLTISRSFCENDDPPEFQDLFVTVDCVKRRGQILVQNPNDVAVAVTITGPDDFEATQEVGPDGTITFDDLVDGVYELTTDHEEIGLDQPTVEIACTTDEPTDLTVSYRCIEGRGQITVTNPNDIPVTLTVTGPDDFEEVLEMAPGETRYLADLADGTYTLDVDHETIGVETKKVVIDCPECVEIPIDPAEQYPVLLDLELPDPMTVEVHLEDDGDPASTDHTLDVAVRNHHGEFQETPTTTLEGDTEVTFEEGVGRFTIGTAGSDADLELIPLEENGVTFDEIDDVETIEVDPGEDLTVVGLAICW